MCGLGCNYYGAQAADAAERLNESREAPLVTRVVSCGARWGGVRWGGTAMEWAMRGRKRGEKTRRLRQNEAIEPHTQKKKNSFGWAVSKERSRCEEGRQYSCGRFEGGREGATEKKLGKKWNA